MEKNKFTCQLVEHEEAYELSYRLAQQILKSGYRPDVVVAIARGGFPPARYICDFLDLSELTSLRIKHYAAGGQEHENTDLKHPLNVQVKNRNILIIDDVNDTGKTLQVAVEHLADLKPKNIKVGVLHEKQGTDFAADFVALFVKEWRWITYPWAMVEDMKKFLNKSGSTVDSLENARSYLKLEYDINITKSQLEKVLALK
jgi:uncharacterized protein